MKTYPYRRWTLKNIKQLCACGCGTFVFGTWVRGHCTRIHKEYASKVSATEKAQYRHGGRIPTYHSQKTRLRISQKLLVGYADGRIKSTKGTKRTPAQRAKMSKIARQAWALGRRNIVIAIRSKSRYHHSWVDTKKAGRVWAASGWERDRILFLDSCPSVEVFCKDRIRIPYKFLGKTRTYIPDFLIQYKTGVRVLEEVRPAYRTKEPKEQAKFRAARTFCKSAGYVFHLLLCEEELSGEIAA